LFSLNFIFLPFSLSLPPFWTPSTLNAHSSLYLLPPFPTCTQSYCLLCKKQGNSWAGGTDFLLNSEVQYWSIKWLWSWRGCCYFLEKVWTVYAHCWDFTSSCWEIKAFISKITTTCLK
jgi:hypothetical protein